MDNGKEEENEECERLSLFIVGPRLSRVNSRLKLSDVVCALSLQLLRLFSFMPILAFHYLSLSPHSVIRMQREPRIQRFFVIVDSSSGIWEHSHRWMWMLIEHIVVSQGNDDDHSCSLFIICT